MENNENTHTLNCLIAYFYLSVYSQTLFEKGYKEFMADNYNKAETLFNESINKKQELSKSYLYIGASKIFDNKYLDAKKYLDASFALDSLDSNLYLYYGKYYAFNKEFEKSISSYNQAIHINSLFANAYNERGSVKGLLRDFDGSIKDLDYAISIDSTEAKYYSNRAYTKIIMGNLKEALVDVNKSLKLKPTQKAYVNKGYIFISQSEYSKAIECFNHSLEINPNDPETLYYRGNCYERLGIFEKACEDYIKSNSIINNSDLVESIKRLKCK